jgi:sporulation integral membrane protein YtvI
MKDEVFMFTPDFLRNLKHFGIFFLIYTALFVLLYSTMSFTFPFILAFGIAFIIQPVTKFFRNRLKFKKNTPALLASLLVYIVLFGLLAFLFYSILSEAKQLLVNLASANLDLVIQPIKNIIHEIGVYFQQIDPTFIEKNSSQFASLLQNGLNIAGKSLSAFLSLALSVPMWITILFVVILSTYFFSRDMTSIKKKFISVFSEKGRAKFENVWSQGIRMLSSYAKAYFFIYFLTFLQTLIGFSILGVKYTVILSIICAVADILPILGIGIIYLPIALIYMLSGSYFTAIGILVLFILISAVRQIVEPKIVSTSLGIHPVMTLLAIFIGLKAFGFAGMIYLTFLMVFYKVLKNSKIL